MGHFDKPLWSTPWTYIREKSPQNTNISFLSAGQARWSIEGFGWTFLFIFERGPVKQLLKGHYYVIFLCGWICRLLCYSVGRKSTLLLKFFSTIFNMPSLRWTGPVDKISVLLTIKIVVHLMTWSLTPAQTTGKCWSVLQMTPALSTLLAGSQ